MTFSSRWWCPSCHIERTGDRLDMPCSCMSAPQRREDRYLKRLRTPKVSPSSNKRVEFVVIEGGLAA